MSIRVRNALLFSLVIFAASAILGYRLLRPKLSLHAATLTSTPSQSYLVILGVGDKVVTNWDGTVTATGATVLGIQGWRFNAADSITGTTGWKLSTRAGAQGAATTAPAVDENGVIITLSAATGPVSIAITTPRGNFSFSPQDVPFGTSKTFLAGKVYVAPTGTPQQLTSSGEEEDFPAMAQSGDDVYLTYTRFVHGDRTLAQLLTTKSTITDFSFLARPTGGDQILLMHYSKSQRTWTGPFSVTQAGEDAMRSTVAVDGQGRAWVIYSVQRNGNFDLYARIAQPDGTMSDEQRITTDAGTDIFPVAATDATGRVWIAWQGFRNNNLEILASVQNGDSFWPETTISTSGASDWDPAIAAAPNGEVSISWDTYDKGDYDVYVRRVRFNNQIVADPPIAVAATVNFEARSSLAYDPQNRLWIAYEVSGPRWGKDFGAFDTTGIGIYQNHNIQVRCLVGNDLYATTDDVQRTLPGASNGQLFETTSKGPFPTQPDPTLSQKRGANNGVGGPNAPKNSFPRLATDSNGTVYLSFRRTAGDGLSLSTATGSTIGSIWVGSMVYFDGARWNGDNILANSDSVSDNRPTVLTTGAGQLLIAQATDHRLSPAPRGTPAADGANSDVYALELNIATSPTTPQLQKIGQVTPDQPDSNAAAEASAATLSRSYRPTVNGQRLQLVRGDFHRHTEVSFDGRGDGPLVDAYRYAIDAAALGWIGCCDHDNGGAREYTWWIVQKFTDAFSLGDRFIPMYYYERSIAYPEGHRNILFSKRGIRTLPRLPTDGANSPFKPAPDTTMLYAYLHFFGGISAPHTSATDQGTDWRNNDPEVEPFVEIYQGDRQSYEMPGAPRSNTATDSISGYEAAGYVSKALDMGYKLGFEASSDHISTHISYTNIWIAQPTRSAIIDAMKARRLYGSTDNILADFRSGAHFMGETFNATANPVFTVRLWGTQPFQSVTVVKDGAVAYSTSGDRVLSFTWQDTSAVKGKTSYYYVRGVQTDGQIVWVSPMWVTML